MIAPDFCSNYLFNLTLLNLRILWITDSPVRMTFNLSLNKLKFCCCFLFSALHTNAQLQDSVYQYSVQQDHFAAFRLRSSYLPIALIALGSYANKEEDIINNLAIKRERDEMLPHFRTHIDDYMQFAPIVAGYSYGAAFQPQKLWIYTKEVLINEAIVCVSVRTVKHASKVPSIVNGSYNAFPSGHTTQAFSAATLFNDNFANGNVWLKTAPYASASTVGVLRILNERHWTSDVIAGAGFGILSAKLSELITKTVSAKKPHKVLTNP